MATKVTLRERPISGNRNSLYLDFYPAIINPETGKETRREFLNLFIYSDFELQDEKYVDGKGKEQRRLAPVLNRKLEPKKLKLTPLEKQHNKEALEIAERIRQKKHKEVNQNEGLSQYEKRLIEKEKTERAKAEQNFVEYFKRMADKRKASNHDNWISCYNYLKDFTNGVLKFADLNQIFCNEFKEHLMNSKTNRSSKVTLSQNSASSYFNKIKAALKQAYKDEYLITDLNKNVPSIKPAETQRNFLTREELNTLIKTDCVNPLLKNAALFSALTGLRFSDIQKLTWQEVIFMKGQGHFIHFTQQKTKNVEVLPISEQAVKLIGKRGEEKQRVFDGLTYSAYSNKHLAQWIGAAGITKNITFHCFRHTYATLQLSLGTSIHTISKLLGHRELKTTQVYAKIIDQTKRDAAEKIILEF